MYNVLIQILAGFAILLGKIFLRSSGKVYTIRSQDLQNVLIEEYPTANLSLADYTYAYVDLARWQQMFLRIVAMLKPYVKDVRDCDDFADFLKGIVSMLFGINTCFRVSGTSKGGTAHAFSMIIYREGNEVKTALVESQNLSIGCEGYTVSSIRG